MLSSKKAKGIFWAFGWITILVFTYSMGKMCEAESRLASHPMAMYFATVVYAAYVLGMLLSVGFLLGSILYLVRSEVKSRSGMVRASGLLVSSLSAVVIGWVLAIGMMITGNYSFAFSGWIEDVQIFNVLPATICFSLVYLTAWRLFTPVKKKLMARKRQEQDSEKKKLGYRRYLQVCGLFFSIFTLMFLPISVQYLKGCFRIPQPTQTWYISAWIHGASVVLAGIELLIGIDLLLDSSKGKTFVGALLLGDSSVVFFTIWFCYILIAAVVFDWGFGNYNVYTGSVLLAIVHRIVSVILLMLALLVSGKKKNNHGTQTN